MASNGTHWDPDDTAVMLHMDGADGSTTFTDEVGNTFTTRGSAQIDTAQSKFGGASGLFNAGSIDTPSFADIVFGTGMFTIDFWIRWAALASDQMIVGTKDAAGETGGWAIRNDGVNIVVFVQAGTSHITWAHSSLSTATWYHFAVVRDSGDTLRFFVDGTQEATAASVTDNVVAQDELTIGNRTSDDKDFTGHIDELRIVKGTAVWTANFTPPSAAYQELTSSSLNTVGRRIGRSIGRGVMNARAGWQRTKEGLWVKNPAFWRPGIA